MKNEKIRENKRKTEEMKVIEKYFKKFCKKY